MNDNDAEARFIARIRGPFAWVAVFMLIFAIGFYDDKDSSPASRYLIVASVISVPIALSFFREEIVGWLRLHKTSIGTGLIIIGVGIMATLMPDTLRDVVRGDVGDLRDQHLVIGAAAVIVAGGWFLRRSGTSN